MLHQGKLRLHQRQLKDVDKAPIERNDIALCPEPTQLCAATKSIADVAGVLRESFLSGQFKKEAWRCRRPSKMLDLIFELLDEFGGCSAILSGLLN